MRLDWMAIALSSMLIAPTFAQTAEHHPVFIFGDGLANCSEFLKRAETERKTRPSSATATQIYDKDYAELVMYADGFLTGANLWDVQNSLVGDSTDTLGRMAWLENYCRTYPLEKFFNALLSFRNFLKDRSEFPKDQSK